MLSFVLRCSLGRKIYQLGEPALSTLPGTHSCNPHADPPVYGDCWYNCTLDDISGEDKKHRLRKVTIRYLPSTLVILFLDRAFGQTDELIFRINS